MTLESTDPFVGSYTILTHENATAGATRYTCVTTVTQFTDQGLACGSAVLHSEQGHKIVYPEVGLQHPYISIYNLIIEKQL